jgi:hypothetical protein
MEKNGIKKTNVDLFVTWRLMKRWHNYLLIGLVFGIFDWFYLDWLSHGLRPN